MYTFVCACMHAFVRVVGVRGYALSLITFHIAVASSRCVDYEQISDSIIPLLYIQQMLVCIKLL